MNDHSISSPRRSKLWLAAAALILAAAVAAMWSAAMPVFAGINSQNAPGEIGRGFTALITATEKQPGAEGALLAHQVLAEIYRIRGETELSEYHKEQGAGAITFEE